MSSILPPKYNPAPFSCAMRSRHSRGTQVKTSLGDREFSHQKSIQGFSLVELLAVLAILSILATLQTTFITSILQGRSVANAVDVVSNLAAEARQTAISKGKPIALVISRSTGANATESQSVMHLAFTGVDANGENIWTPTSRWTPLPTRVAAAVYTRGNTASFYPGGSGVINTLPTTLHGNTPDYDYVVFQPDGSVDAPAINPSLTFRRLNKSDSATDYMLVLTDDSGRSKVIGD